MQFQNSSSTQCPPHESLLSEALPLVFNIPRDALEKVNTAPEPPLSISTSSSSVVKSGRLIEKEEDDEGVEENEERAFSSTKIESDLFH